MTMVSVVEASAFRVQVLDLTALVLRLVVAKPKLATDRKVPSFVYIFSELQRIYLHKWQVQVCAPERHLSNFTYVLCIASE